MTLRNFLTFDIEEWFHANYSGMPPAAAAGETALEAQVERLMELCAEHGVRTTCFVLGSIAREKPSVVRRLHAAGHEIASHGCAHQLVYTMGPAQFAQDVRVSCALLEDITGERIAGFRAPSFSVTGETLAWYYDVLEEAGLVYSSSVFPGRTFLYGVPDFPARIHRPVVAGKQRGIVEFPAPVVRLAAWQVGLYIRLFPAWAMARRMARENRAGNPVVLYVHPRELDPDQPPLALRWPHSLIHYWGIRGCEAKLRALLKSQRFGRMKDAAADFAA